MEIDPKVCKYKRMTKRYKEDAFINLYYYNATFTFRFFVEHSSGWCYIAILKCFIPKLFSNEKNETKKKQKLIVNTIPFQYIVT